MQTVGGVVTGARRLRFDYAAFLISSLSLSQVH